MNTLILAAGRGERMRPLTLTTPKPLLPAAGQPLIVHQLQRLAAAGIRHLVINTAWLGEQIEQALGDGADFGLGIRYSREPEPLETLGGLRNALPLFDDGDWILVVNGDIWSDFDFHTLWPLPDPQHCLARLVLVDNPGQHPQGDFHLDKQGQVHGSGPDQLTFAGISLLHRQLIEQAPLAENRLAPVLKTAMTRGLVSGLHHQGQWQDIGTPERLANLDRQLRQQDPHS
ncbi:MAG: nucleotidyltransferase family protein [Halomonadaceae bacterium]|nr:MAG: nucleotidyltransferase family protein [Halomonadaceae bacterium]